MNVTFYNGKLYNSDKEMCEDLAVDYQRFINRKHRGYSIDEALEKSLKPNGKPINLIVGDKKISFNSYKKLCKYLGVDYHRFICRKTKKLSNNKIIFKGRLSGYLIVIDGKVFTSLSSALKFCNVSYYMFRKKYDGGYPLAECFNLPNGEVVSDDL